MKEKQLFKIGDKVKTKNLKDGIITKVTCWDGQVWYDVRVFDGSCIVGEKVCYNNDLQLRTV